MIKQWLANREQRLADAREHQLNMMREVTNALKVMADGQMSAARETSSALIAIAQANSAQADAFTTWIKSFQTTSAPDTSTVREEDEYLEERQRVANHYGIPLDILDDVPAEFKLTQALQSDFAADVRRDNKP